MSFSIQYKQLFEVDLLHLFFLNKGNNQFFLMTADDQKAQLASYNVTSFIQIKPTNLTKQKIDGCKLVFKTTATGFSIWTKVSESDQHEPFIKFEDSFTLTFILQVKDSRFLNYTDLELSNAGKIYFFSNKRPLSEPPAFPLIQPYGIHVETGDSFILSNVGAFEQTRNFSVLEKNNLLGIVSICMKGENNTLDITDSLGKIRSPFMRYEILFGNRKTFWRYLFNTLQTVEPGDDVQVENGDAKILITKSGQPLTQNGFVSIELGEVELPNPDASLIKPNSTNNKIYSEIYM